MNKDKNIFKISNETQKNLGVVNQFTEHGWLEQSVDVKSIGGMKSLVGELPYQYQN
jgi:hypothetical protein